MTRQDDHISQALSGLPPILTLTEAAEALRVTRRQVCRWLAAGQIRGYKFTPRQRGAVRVTRDSLADFLRQRAA